MATTVSQTQPLWNSYTGFTSPPTDTLLISSLDGIYCSCRFFFVGFGVSITEGACSFNFDLDFLPNETGSFGGGNVFLNFNPSLLTHAKDFVILLPQAIFSDSTLTISIPNYLNDSQSKIINGVFFYKLSN